MGIFDSLLGLKTTDATDKATAAQNSNLQNVQNGNNQTLLNTTQAAGDALNTGTNSALSSLIAGNTAANGALTSYGTAAQGALANGVNSAVGTVQGSNAQYAPYVANGQSANGLYADSLGLNGASGNAAATSAFQAAPGYQWSVDQATDAAARKASSLGMAASGNTLDAITRLGSNLANQEYGNWQSDLNGLSNTGLSAANAVSGNNSTAAGFQNQGGTLQAMLDQQLGTGLSTNDKSLANGQANLQSGLGNSLATLQSGLGSNEVNNAWTGAKTISGNALAGATADDNAASANNGIFSSLISNVLGGLGNTATGQSAKNLFAQL